MRVTICGLFVLSSLLGAACSGGSGSSAPGGQVACGTSTCVDHASCVETVEGPQCVCDAGYTGPGTISCSPIDAGNCPLVPAPTVPQSPSPTDKGDKSSIVSLTLGWSEPADTYSQYDLALSNAPSSCQDISRVATTKVDIYFGTTDPPALLKQDVGLEQGCQSDGSKVCFSGLAQEAGQLVQRNNYEVTTELNYGTAYYWRIVIRNKDGISSEGPVWSFTTKADITCPGMPTVTDQDGNSYDTVQVGSQCWMNRNLSRGTLKPGTQTDNGVIEKSCYGSESSPDCSGFYSWNEATNYANPGTICPAGWHLPTVQEWQQLINHADFGNFAPQYQGYKNNSNIGYGSLGGYYWTADEKVAGPTGTAHVAIFHYPTKNLSPELSSYNKSSLLMSVRCVQ